MQQKAPKLTVKEKVVKNYYKCNSKTEHIRADNAKCIKKTVQSTSSTFKAPQTRSTQGTGSCSLAYNYDWPKDIAYRICMLESGGNPNAANWSDDHTSWAGCMGSFGLMQINCSNGQLYDGKKNMAVAYSMYKGWGNSFRAWTTCAKVSGCY